MQNWLKAVRKMTKLVLFDLDGTLLDTLQDLTNSVNYAMTKLNLPTYTAEQVKGMIGNGVVVLMQRALTNKHINLHSQALTMQRSYYSQHNQDNTKPYDGILDMLADLKRRGFTLAIHTNKDEASAIALCKKHFGGLIDYVCGTTSAVTKPNPEKALNLMEKLGVEKQNATYCGDSDVDILTANNAGIRCISVTWGFRTAQFLAEHGATYLADSPKTLLKTIVGLL